MDVWPEVPSKRTVGIARRIAEIVKKKDEEICAAKEQTARQSEDRIISPREAMQPGETGCQYGVDITGSKTQTFVLDPRTKTCDVEDFQNKQDQTSISLHASDSLRPDDSLLAGEALEPMQQGFFYADDVANGSLAAKSQFKSSSGCSLSQQTIYENDSDDRSRPRTTSNLASASAIVTNAIRRIPIDEARAKTYLAARFHHRAEMSNEEELKKFFPNGRAVIYIGTYNLAGKIIPVESLRDWLLAKDCAHAADIYAIGIQEAPLNT